MLLEIKYISRAVSPGKVRYNMRSVNYGKKVMEIERRRVASMSRQECLDKIFGKATVEAAARAAKIVENEKATRVDYATKVAAINHVKALLVFGVNVDAKGDRFHRNMDSRFGVIEIEGTVLIHGSAIVDRVFLNGINLKSMLGNLKVIKLSDLVYEIRTR